MSALFGVQPAEHGSSKPSTCHDQADRRKHGCTCCLHWWQACMALPLWPCTSTEEGAPRPPPMSLLRATFPPISGTGNHSANRREQGAARLGRYSGRYCSGALLALGLCGCARLLGSIGARPPVSHPLGHARREELLDHVAGRSQQAQADHHLRTLKALLQRRTTQRRAARHRMCMAGWG